jgi:hypothetical protein
VCGACEFASVIKFAKLHYVSLFNPLPHSPGAGEVCLCELASVADRFQAAGLYQHCFNCYLASLQVRALSEASKTGALSLRKINRVKSCFLLLQHSGLVVSIEV